MGVTTNLINKPFNPRGNDQSPLAYNRAKLYSGKALDFDGVNDYLASGAFSLDTSEWSASMILKNDTAGSDQVFLTFAATGSNDESFIFYNNFGNSNKISFYGAAFTGSPVNFDYVIPTDYEHLTFTFASNTLSLYVNGVFVDSGSVTGNDGTQTASAIVGARKQASYGQYFDGQVSGVKMYSTALTAAQVADLYNNPEKVVPTGVDNTALKLWLPMMEGAGTYCINGADPLGNDEYNGAGSFDSSTGWTLNTGFSIGSGSLSCNGTQTAATSAYYNISSVASSLVMVQFTLSNVTAGQVQLAFFGASGTTTKWYTANGTYTEYVEVQAGHNGNTGFIANADFVGDIDDLTLKVVNTGAISGATWTHGVGAPIAQTAVIDWNKETTGAGTTMLLPQGLTTGRDITGVNLFENVRKQGALNLDGNSWAEVHDNASFDFGTAVSLEAWVYWQGDNDDDGIIGRYGSTNAERDCTLYAYSGGIQFYVTLSAVSYTSMTNGWRHIVGTYDGANKRLYVDGAQVNSSAETSTMPGGSIPMEIGRYNESASKTFTQPIAQPRIYNRALTAEEVQRSYDSGKNIFTNS